MFHTLIKFYFFSDPKKLFQLTLGSPAMKKGEYLIEVLSTAD